MHISIQGFRTNSFPGARSENLGVHFITSRSLEETGFDPLLRKISTFWSSTRKNIRLISIIKGKSMINIIMLTNFRICLDFNSLGVFWHFGDLQHNG